jgi:hypothetical protein
MRGGPGGGQAGPELARSREHGRSGVSLLDTAYAIDAPLLGHEDADNDEIAGPVDAWVATIADSDPIPCIPQPLFNKSAGLVVFFVDDNVPGMPHARILGRPGGAAMSGGLPRISIEMKAKWARTPLTITYSQWLLSWWK